MYSWSFIYNLYYWKLTFISHHVEKKIINMVGHVRPYSNIFKKIFFVKLKGYLLFVCTHIYIFWILPRIYLHFASIFFSHSEKTYLLMKIVKKFLLFGKKLSEIDKVMKSWFCHSRGLLSSYRNFLSQWVIIFTHVSSRYSIHRSKISRKISLTDVKIIHSFIYK